MFNSTDQHLLHLQIMLLSIGSDAAILLGSSTTVGLLSSHA